jgi:hypothetical protein
VSVADPVEPLRYPVVPRPIAGELLSGWIERAGLFYGTPYEPWVASLLARAGVIASPTRTDLDVDRGVHDVMRLIARCDEALIPPILPSTSHDVLILDYRIAFCPDCWNDDVAGGGVPFVRRAWADWHTIICPIHQRFLWTRRRFGHRVAQGSPSWAPLWSSRATWAKALPIPRDHGLTEEVLSYSPFRPLDRESAVVVTLSADTERFFAVARSPRVPECQVFDDHRRAARVLELTLSQGFIPVFEDLRCEILGRQAEARLRALRFDSMDYLSAPLRPQLLENRATLLIMVVEILRMMENRSAINERYRRALTLSVLAERVLDNPDTQRYLRLWSEADRAMLARCWPTGPAARLKVREILAQRRSKRLQ